MMLPFLLLAAIFEFTFLPFSNVNLPEESADLIGALNTQTDVTRKPPELLKLGFLVGKWAGESFSPATQWFPESRSSANVTFQWALGGYHLEGNFSYQVAENPYNARSFWSYSVDEKKYYVHWIDDHSSHSYTYAGNFKNDSTLILVTKRKIEQQIVTERLVLTQTSKNRWKLVSESDPTGDFVVGGIITVKRQ